MSYLYIEKIDKWISFTHEKVKHYHKKILIISVIILIIITLYPTLHNTYLNFNLPAPPENQLVVAITPFYYVDESGNEGYDINIRDDFKEKLDNLEIKIILLDENINNIEDAKFQGQKVGAHLIIYGETKKTSIETGKIQYTILPLPIIETTVSDFTSLNYPGKNDLKLTEIAKFSIYTDKSITIIESLVSNASSSIATIAAFDKYIKSDYTSAICFFKSTNDYGVDPIISFYIANCYLSNDNLNESLQNFDKAIEINPRFERAWHNKGVALWSLGRFEEALEAFNKTIEINPRFEGAWSSKGNALRSLGRSEEALEAYDNAIEINPRFEEAWYNKGSTLCILGRSEEALEAYDTAIEINPRFEEAWCNKGVALRSLGRFEEALEAYDTTIEINPRYEDAWYNKGYTLWSLGRSEEALEAYDTAIEINPRYEEAWYNKGVALRSLGRSEEALEAYNKASEFNPAVKN